MPNDSLFIKKSIAAREGLGDLFLKKKKKELSELDEYIKQPNDPEYKRQAQEMRDSISKRGYTKEELDARDKRGKKQQAELEAKKKEELEARIKRAKMQSMREGL